MRGSKNKKKILKIGFLKYGNTGGPAVPYSYYYYYIYIYIYKVVIVVYPLCLCLCCVIAR
jgi:hypothetical protein